MLIAPSVHAASLTWDISLGNGATITGGTGTWTNGLGNWNTGAGDTTWNNATPDAATFGGTAGTVTLGGAVNVSNITFDADYLIDGGGNTLTLASSTITTNTNATLNATLDGTTGLVKSGGGTLSLSGSTANIFTGLTTVSAGTLQLGMDGGAVNAIAGGGLTVSSGATVQYTGNSTDMMGAGAVTLNGTGKLDFNGKTDTIGAVTIVATGAGAGTTPIKNTAGGGNLTIGELRITPVAGFTSVIDSGTGTLTHGLPSDITYMYFNAATTGQAQITGSTLALGSQTRIDVAPGTGAGYDLEISSAITGPGSLALRDDIGRLQLSGSTSNTYTSTSISHGATLLLNKSGSANAIAGFFNALTISSGTVKYVGTSTDMISNTASVTIANGTLDFNGKTDTIGNVGSNFLGQGSTPLKNTAGGGNLTIDSLDIKPMNGSTTSVFNAGIGGTLTLGGTVTFTASSGGGSTAGRAQITGTTLALGSNRIFNIAAGTGSTYDLEISNAITGSTNTLTKSTGTGRLQFSGTTANTYDGLTTVSAGTLILNKTAALAIAGNLTIGDGATTAGLDIVQLSGTGGNQIANTAILTLNGTTTNAGTFRMNALSETVGGLVSTGGAGIVENGTAGTSTLTLDVNTTDLAFAGILQNGTAGTLALTKTGTATQTLSGSSNTYAGATTVTVGELRVMGSIATSSLTTVNGGTLSGSGTVGAVTLVSGVLAPGTSPGTLNSGNLLFSGGTFSVELASAVLGDQMNVTGTAGLGANTELNISLFGGYDPQDGDSWVLVNNDGTDLFTTGAFAFTTSGSPILNNTPFAVGGEVFLLQYNAGTGGNDVVLGAVPEPTSALLLLGSGALLLLRRRRTAG